MDYSRLRYILCLFLSLIFLSVSYSDSFSQEDTAHLSFQKTATLSAKTRQYVVKEGDWLFNIMRSQAGITEHRLTVIKKLNPDLKDVNKIRPGQVIVLPEKENPAVSEGQEGSETYTIRKGDSISRIAMRELNVKWPELRKAVEGIKQLNPNIKNYNKIYPGQTLQLPRRSIVITKQEAKPSEPEAAPKVVAKEEMKEKPAVLPQASLDIIRTVVGRMNGSLISVGKYYIPIPELGQVTIDCATIPIIELDDGSSIFLDFSNRIPDTLKKMIQSNWKDYHSVEIGAGDGTAAILQKIVGSSNRYTMVRRATPYVVGTSPPLQLSIDWLITRKSQDSRPYMQGLLFVSDDSSLLPKVMVTYAERNGIIITEIMERSFIKSDGIYGQGVISAPDEKYVAPEISNLKAGTSVELAASLLNEVGYETAKDADVAALDASAGGVALSLKVDSLAKKGDKQIVVLARKIPQQFIDNLKARGTEPVFVEAGEMKKPLIDRILRAAGIPFSFGTFSFSVPEKANNPVGTVSFPAFKITRDKGDFYLIDFDIDRDIYALLNNKWGVNIVRY